MSLRHYLFSLIGTLILLLTIVQLTLVYWIDKNLEKEVNTQAKLISERAVEFVFRTESSGEQSNTDTTPQVIHLPDKSGQTKVIVMPENGEVVEAKSFTVIEDVNINADDVLHEKDKVIIKRRLAEVIDSLGQADDKNLTKHVEHLPNGQAFAFEHSVTTSSTSQQLINSIQLMILICALLATLFAYWLSMRFNKPLKELKQGFDALAKQDYDHRIKPQGVDEIKQTMIQFNDMLDTLASLKAIEQHYKESAHLAELGEVSRGLAHTLRNPIHTIGLSIERLIENHLTDEERFAIAQVIQTKISHIDNNIKSLLTLTTTGISRDQQVPVLAVVQDFVLECKSAPIPSQSFTLAIENDLFIFGAESEIRSILHTLIINACEANDERGDIHVSATSNSEAIIIRVEDQGSGLDDAIANQLFEPHVSSKPEGAGMGLYIAQRIISLHYQGNISLRNKAEHNGCVATATFKREEV